MNISVKSDLTLATLCILWYRFMRLFSMSNFCEALNGLEFNFQCSRSTFVIFRDFQIGIVAEKVELKSGIKSDSEDF